MIHRAEHEGDFTQIDNALLRDTSLSEGARSLLFYMLSMSDDWNFSVKALAKQFRVETTTIFTRISELKNKGYLQVTRNKGNDGRFSSCTWDIYEKVPHSEITTYGENHTWKKPHEEITTRGKNHTGLNTNIKNINTIEHQTIKKIKGEEEAHALGIYQNVFLTDEEQKDLTERLGFESVAEYVDRLSTYMKENPGKTFKNHKATIEKWIKEDEGRTPA